MIKVGITGGIGSGKSTASRIFGVLGVPVYYADEAARTIMNEDAGVRASLIDAFGEMTYLEGRLNRTWLASRVFNDPLQLQLLNSITHPATIRHADQWMQTLEQRGISYAIKEAALLFESGSVKHLDFVIGVSAPVAMRIRRIMDRDGATAEEVRSRMDRQLDEPIKMKLCDAVLINDEQQALIPQVLKLHEQFKGMSAEAGHGVNSPGANHLR